VLDSLRGREGKALEIRRLERRDIGRLLSDLRIVNVVPERAGVCSGRGRRNMVMCTWERILFFHFGFIRAVQALSHTAHSHQWVGVIFQSLSSTEEAYLRIFLGDLAACVLISKVTISRSTHGEDSAVGRRAADMRRLCTC
jgi:hypothetical protein